MSKQKKNTRTRKAEREQAKKKSRMQAGIVTVVLLVFIAGLALVINSQNSAVQVSDEVLARAEPFRGAVDAPITLIEYGAYGCHACKIWHEEGVIEDLLKEFDGSLKFIFRDLPIIDPPYSHMASGVAECALDQGQDAFWKLHDAIYERAEQGRASMTDIINLGIEEGLDGDTLRTCSESDLYRDVVNYDLQRGRALGLRGTPAWVLNDRIIYNASPLLLRDEIEKLLAGVSTASK